MTSAAVGKIQRRRNVPLYFGCACRRRCEQQNQRRDAVDRIVLAMTMNDVRDGRLMIVSSSAERLQAGERSSPASGALSPPFAPAVTGHRAAEDQPAVPPHPGGSNR